MFKDVTRVVVMQPVPESVLREQPDVLIPKPRKLVVQMGVLGGNEAALMVVLAENVKPLPLQPQRQSHQQ